MGKIAPEEVERDQLADAIERVLFRRCIQDRLCGYTLEASRELAQEVRSYLETHKPEQEKGE